MLDNMYLCISSIFPGCVSMLLSTHVLKEMHNEEGGGGGFQWFHY